MGWQQLPQALERRPIDLVLIDAQVRDPLPFPRLSWLRRQHPHVASLIVLDARGRELDLFRLGRLGVDEVLLDGPDAGLAGLPGALDRALVRAAARRVGARVGGRAPTLFLDGLVWAVEHADESPTPEALAHAVARSVDSYRRALRAADLPPPTRILLWGRLIRAAHLLENEQLTVERIAHGLGYAAATSLARALRRETGASPSELRAHGGLSTVLDALLAGRDLPLEHRVGPRGR